MLNRNKFIPKLKRKNDCVSLMKVWNLLTKTEMREASADVGADIRKFRDESCYKQEDVARELGIGRSAYQKIETGTAKITIDRLEQIAQILGKPIAAFI